MAVTRDHNELILQPPPGARFQTNLAGQAVLTVKRGTEKSAIAYLKNWIETYTEPMAAFTASPVPPRESTPPSSETGPMADETVTARATPGAMGLCEVVHTSETQQTRCGLGKDHAGAHAAFVGGVWYHLDRVPRPKEEE